MRVSIITATYNVASTLQDTVDSVARQTYDDVEHIVVDGMSTDGTDEIINNNRQQLAKVIREPDSGLYDAMNKGLDKATGDVIGILNGDDFYADEDVLEYVMNAFKDPAIDAIYADLVYVSQENTNKIVRYWTSVPYKDGLFNRGWIPAHPTFFVRKKIYDQYGGFDLHYKIQSDFEICLRFLAVHKITSRYLPRILVRMRMGGVTNNSIKSILKGNLESYRACQQHGLNITPWFFIKKWCSRLPQFVQRPVSQR